MDTVVFFISMGIVYTGQFKDGQMHGRGVVKTSDGRIIEEGVYKNNKLIDESK